MLEKANSELVRRQNRSLVLETLRQFGPQARISLGQRTGLSLASITSITSQLLDEGLLLIEAENTTFTGRRGRPLTNLVLNPKAAGIIVVTISVDGIELVYADYGGTTHHAHRLVRDSYEIAAKKFGPMLAQEIRNHAQKHGIDLAIVMAIGVAVQGVADSVKGEISWSPAFKARGIPVVKPVFDELGIPCTIANNSNMIAAALLNVDRLRYGGTTAAVYLGHGVGMGLILEGRIFSGASGGAGEFGHMNHMPDGPLCRCGLAGCLEAFLADYGLLRLAGSSKSQAHDIHQPVREDEIAALQRAAESGDAASIAAYEQAGRALGYSLARLMATINPSKIVLCGPGTRAYHLLAPAMTQALQKGLVAELLDNVEIEIAPFESDMIVTGTLIEALRQLDRGIFAQATKPLPLNLTGRITG